MSKFTYDPHFKNFSDSLQYMLQDTCFGSSNFTELQKKQVESLIKAEKDFKKILQNDSRGKKAYQAFLNFIWKCGKNEGRNTLVSRPYFRERHSSFAKGISKALRTKNIKMMFKFNINYLFIDFSLKAVNWGENSKITKAAKVVWKIRNEIIQQNLPLAISRARIFRHRTPNSHLSYMDLVQISSEGLISAVDKFVPPYTTVFRGVIIGRIVGDLIVNYSEKMLHFYPSDKRKIYRANKVQKNNEDNFEQISRLVNEGPKLDSVTNPDEIHRLILASSHWSLDSPVPNSGVEPESFADKLIDETKRPDILMEQSEIKTRLIDSIKQLNILEQKLLKMQGVGQ